MDAPSRVDKPIGSTPDGTLDILLKSENIASSPSEDDIGLNSALKDKNPHGSQNPDGKSLEDVNSDKYKVVIELSTESKPDVTMEVQTRVEETEGEIPGEVSPEIHFEREIDQAPGNSDFSSDDVDHPVPIETSEDRRSVEVFHKSCELVEENQGENEPIDMVEMVKRELNPENELQDELARPLGTPPPSYQAFIQSQGEIAAAQTPEVQTTELQDQSSSNTTSIPLTSVEPVEVKPISKTLSDVSKDASVHQIKWLQFEGTRVPIITQNENGPCPMIAITNVLLLRRKISLPKDHEIVSSDLIIQTLSEELFSQSTANFDEEMRANYEENLYSAFSIFPKLQTGLDINVRFTGVGDFEYTTALAVFDLFRIPIFHGWVVDAQDVNLAKVLNNQTYNQVVEMIIGYKTSDDADQVHKGLLAEEFLKSTASQLTLCGLCELNDRLREGELAVFFRNNHFNTIYKKKGTIYVLLTDVGFVNESNFVWETLNNIDGDSQFVDSEFKVVTESSSPLSPTCTSTDAKSLTPSAPIYPTQMDLAQRLALEQADLELAKQLQEEERAAFLNQSSAASKTLSDVSPVATMPTHGAHTSPTQSSQPQKIVPADVTGGQDELNSPASSTSSPPSSWQQASDLELAKQLQAEEDAAYYAEQKQKKLQQPSSPRSPQLQQSSQQPVSRRSPPTSHSSPSGNRRDEHQHNRSNAHQRDPSPPWKCTIS
nr:protein FAM63A [Hymenolepis microstoma]